MLHDEEWPPGRALVARCRGEGGHAAPDLACACGLHAAREPEDARAYRVGRDDAWVVGRVLGEVAVWGRVVEGPTGFRGELAYPLRLYAPDALASELDAYGVTIVRERVRPAA